MKRSASARNVKEAVIQGLREHRDELKDLLAEVLEDVAMAHAIEEGAKSPAVSRQRVMKALSSSPRR
jgi:hypothetical protein